MKEYWKTHTFTEEQQKSLSEKKKEYWNDREASEAHRQKLSRLMKEMRAGETGFTSWPDVSEAMANVTVIPATRNLHTGIRDDAVQSGRPPDTPASARTARSSSPATRHRWIITPITSSPARNGNSRASIRK